MIERWAIWYLNKRGIVTLLPSFIGFAIGYGSALKIDTDQYFDHWEMFVPKGSRIIAINNASVAGTEKI